MPEQQKHSFSTGDIVATRRTLVNKRSILAGPLLWADSLGVVLSTSPRANIVEVHFGSVGVVWIRPADLELAGVSVDPDERETLEDEIARLKRDNEQMRELLASQLKPTGARLAHAGSGNGH